MSPEGKREGRPAPADGSRDVRIHRVRGDDVVEEEDALAVEEPLEIRLAWADEPSGPRGVSVTMRTPGHDFELAVGFLFTEGIIRSRDDVVSVQRPRNLLRGPSENVVDVLLAKQVSYDHVRAERNFYTTSSCGVCGKASLESIRVLGVPRSQERVPQIGGDVITQIPDRLRECQRLFAATGGLHSAGRFDAVGQLLSVREDIGRHNAVDKIVGEALLAGRVPMSRDLLAVSGRASFEILQKAAVAGIPVVIAVGAPSSLAVDLAREYGMTLVGFARDHGYNVYADAGRILPTRIPRPGP